jgi:hypothetical protein
VTVLVEDELQGLGEESSTVWVNFVGAKTICFWNTPTVSHRIEK